MAIKLYVDKISSDGTIGMATNQQMLLENAEKLKVVWKEEISQSPVIFSAGRFVCSIAVSKDQNEVGMIFMDLKRNRNFALAASKQFQSLNTQKIFMEVFEKVSKNYKANYEQVELIVNESFVPDVSAN